MWLFFYLSKELCVYYFNSKAATDCQHENGKLKMSWFIGAAQAAYVNFLRALRKCEVEIQFE